jgi:ribosomal protein L11 methyltransferase
MDYIELKFCIDTNNNVETVQNIVSAGLAEVGFESFVTDDDGNLLAYIPENLYDEVQIPLIIDEIPLQADVRFTKKRIKSQNWNEEWEKNYFQPIVIGNECVIHSTFHHDVPAARYNILIDPKMSFGTGHHETTSLVIGEILKTDLQGKSVLDMGCGTCILGILASMRGANPITAIDIDEWCFENSLENLTLNNVSNIEVLKGDATLLANRKFDVIFANINRNILLNDIKTYSKCLSAGGELYMSGFYEADIPVIEAECNANNLKFLHYEKKNNWVVVKFIV